MVWDAYERIRRGRGRVSAMLARAMVPLLFSACPIIFAASVTLNERERAWLSLHPVIRIQMSDCSPPFEFRENGTWHGMAYDMLIAAASEVGLRITVSALSWDESLKRISNGNGVDLLLAVTRSPERERQMLLTLPYLSFPQVIIADRHKRFISSLNDLQGTTVAVERDYVMETWLRRDLPDGTRLLSTGGSAEALTAVSSGKADAYVGNLAVASYLIYQKGLVNLGVVAPSGYADEQYCMGIRTDWPELKTILDYAIGRIPPEKKRAIHQRWLSVRYDYGIKATDIVGWVLIVAVIALIFILQLRHLVSRRTAELAAEVERSKRREEYLAEAQRIAHLGSIVHPIIGETAVCSDEIHRIFGWDTGTAVTLHTYLNAVYPEDREAVTHEQAAAVKDGAGKAVEFRIRDTAGKTRHLLQRSKLITGKDRTPQILSIILDITERKNAEIERARLEKSLVHSEKLRLIGQLAGGIAHDFNNILGGIIGSAELLLLMTPEVDTRMTTMRKHLTNIVQAAKRAAGITAQLRTFSRRDQQVFLPVDIHAVIQEVIDLVRHKGPQSITIRTELAAPIAAVLGDAAILQTAFANIAINAIDAMPTGGTLTITTGYHMLEAPPETGQSFAMHPGPHIVITFTDTGIGMDESIQTKLFEPFFTTKESGKGTGLGLANVLGCIRYHNGAIQVESAPGSGSTFRLFLPAGNGSDMQQRPVAHRESGGGSILIVDDDPLIRETALELLRANDYTVTACADGKEAERVFRERASEFVLVIVDMIMPGMDGEKLIKRLRSIDSSVRILLCSGAFKESASFPIPEADGFLQKPYDREALLAEVGRIKKPVS